VNSRSKLASERAAEIGISDAERLCRAGARVWAVVGRLFSAASVRRRRQDRAVRLDQDSLQRAAAKDVAQLIAFGKAVMPDILSIEAQIRATLASSGEEENSAITQV